MRTADLISFISLAIMALLAAVLAAINLAPGQPEGFTELYFEDELPLELAYDQTHTAYFGIRNQEHRKLPYTYQVFFDGNLTDSGSILLESGQSFSSQTVFRTDIKRDTPMKLSVRLAGRTEEIHSWVIAR